MQAPVVDEEFLTEGPIPVSDVTLRALERIGRDGSFRTEKDHRAALERLRREAFHVEA